MPCNNLYINNSKSLCYMCYIQRVITSPTAKKWCNKLSEIYNIANQYAIYHNHKITYTPGNINDFISNPVFPLYIYIINNKISFYELNLEKVKRVGSKITIHESAWFTCRIKWYGWWQLCRRVRIWWNCFLLWSLSYIWGSGKGSAWTWCFLEINVYNLYLHAVLGQNT